MLHRLPVLSSSHSDASGEKSDRAPEGFGRAFDAEAGAREVLTDGFGRRHTYLRIALVERCNLRCRYCMPAEGLQWTPDAGLLTDEEIVHLARVFVESGVRKIRLTGGEPLLRPNVETLAARIADLDGLETLALTTNGLLLPKKLQALQDAGITHLNVSLDTLRPERFQEMTRRDGFPVVMRAIDAALAAGIAPLKVNCVVMRGKNDDELVDFVAWTENRDLEVRFIEFMPFDGNGWDDTHLVPYDEMRARIERRFPLVPLDDGPSATARTYRVPGFQGRVGFIASMTAPFCEGCNRLRLTADGSLKVCLFGPAEVNLRDRLRNDADDDTLRAQIGSAVSRKHARHAGMEVLADRPNRPMITIGG